MPGLTYSQKYSFSETITEILSQNKQKFIDAGLEVDNRLLKMLEKNKKVTETDAEQETQKAKLLESTKIAVAAVEDSYKFASSTVEAMIGVLGKNDTLAKRLTKLRGQMNKGGNYGNQQPVTA